LSSSSYWGFPQPQIGRQTSGEPSLAKLWAWNGTYEATLD